MSKKKSTRPASADQESGAADPSMVAGSSETSIEKGIDDLTSDLTSGEPVPEDPPQADPEPTPPEYTAADESPAPAPEPPADPEPAPPPASRPKLSPIELGALVLIGIVIIGFAGFLFTIPDDDLPTTDEQSRAAESVPSKADGDLLALSSIEAYWRPLAAADRTDKSSNLLPELSLKVGHKNTGAPAFLKIYFLDPKGEISGDVRTARVEGGKLVDTGRGETVTGADQVSVYGSKGIKDKNAFLAYRYSREDSWAIQVFEGADYSDGPWNTLAYFEIPNKIKGENPAE